MAVLPVDNSRRPTVILFGQYFELFTSVPVLSLRLPLNFFHSPPPVNLKVCAANVCQQ